MRLTFALLFVGTNVVLLSSAANAQSGDSMQAGGLAPPPPMSQQPSQQQQAPTATERELERAEEEDSGRGLEWLYLNVEGGYQMVGLETFSSDGLTYAGTVKTQDGGPMFGAGLGVRLVFLTLGVRGRMGVFEHWNIATLNGEVGIHIPLGNLEPYFTLGGGYAALGALEATSWSANDVSIRGFNARAGFGLDYYVTPVFSVGANLTGEILALTRPGVDLSATATAGTGGMEAEQQRVAAADGSSLGSSGTISAVLGLHF